MKNYGSLLGSLYDGFFIFGGSAHCRSRSFADSGREACYSTTTHDAALEVTHAAELFDTEMPVIWAMFTSQVLEVDRRHIRQQSAGW